MIKPHFSSSFNLFKNFKNSFQALLIFFNTMKRVDRINEYN